MLSISSFLPSGISTVSILLFDSIVQILLIVCLGEYSLMSRVYRLLHPKLTVLVVSKTKDGKVNVMTAAWCMPVSASPPLIAVSIAPSRYTYDIIRESGEFVISIPTVDLLKKVHYCGCVSGRVVDKVKEAGFTLAKSNKVGVPYIKECVASLECRVYKMFELGDHVLVIGEVVDVHYSKEFFDERKGIYDIKKTKLILHLGGAYYATNDSRILRVEE